MNPKSKHETVIQTLTHESEFWNWPLEIYSARFRVNTPSMDSVRFHKAYGKGLNANEAMKSVIGECVERYSGTFHSGIHTQRASPVELGEQGIHPNLCMNYSATQYAQSKKGRPVKNHKTKPIPQPLNEKAAIDWVSIVSVPNNTVQYLPASYCYYFSNGPGNEYCFADSNGCAAGSSRIDACYRGLLELIERDAVGIWWYNKIPRPKIELSSLNDPVCERFKQYFESIDRDLWIVDVTSDLNVPVFVAISTGREKSDIIWFGSCANLDPVLALHGSLLEVGVRLALYGKTLNWFALGRGSIPGNEVLPDPLSFLWAWETTILRNATMGVLNSTVDERFQHLVSICEAKELDVYVLDQSLEELGWPVVRIVVPGLRHYFKRTGPGRLYDVPVQMGWLDAPREESALNFEMPRN